MGNRAKLTAIYPMIEQMGALVGTRRVLVQFCGHMAYYPTAQTTPLVRQWPVSDATDLIAGYFEQGWPKQLTLAGGEPLHYADWIQRLLKQLPKCEVQLWTGGTPVKELAALLPQINYFSLHWKLGDMDFMAPAVQLDRRRSLQLINLRQGELILHLPAALLADTNMLEQKLIAVQSLLRSAEVDSLPVWLAMPAFPSAGGFDEAAFVLCFSIFPNARLTWQAAVESKCEGDF